MHPPDQPHGPTSPLASSLKVLLIHLVWHCNTHIMTLQFPRQVSLITLGFLVGSHQKPSRLVHCAVPACAALASTVCVFCTLRTVLIRPAMASVLFIAVLVCLAPAHWPGWFASALVHARPVPVACSLLCTHIYIYMCIYILSIYIYRYIDIHLRLRLLFGGELHGFYI